MAWTTSNTGAEFGAGMDHLANSGRGNDNSVTLGGGLQADSDRWNSLSPHGVLRTAMGTGSPADTNSGVEFGQQALGNRDDAEQAGQSMDRMLMQRAAGIGSDDNTA
jgi:hypothetical protein